LTVQKAALANGGQQAALEDFPRLVEPVDQRAVQGPTHLLHVGGEGARVCAHRNDHLVDLVIHRDPFRSVRRFQLVWVEAV